MIAVKAINIQQYGILSGQYAPEAYSEPCQTSKMVSLTKRFLLDVWHGPECLYPGILFCILPGPE